MRLDPGSVGPALWPRSLVRCVVCNQMLIAVKRLPVASRCFPWLPVASRCFPCAFPLLIFANLCVWTPGSVRSRSVPAADRCVRVNRCNVLPVLPVLPVASRCFPLLPVRVSAANLC